MVACTFSLCAAPSRGSFWSCTVDTMHTSRLSACTSPTEFERLMTLYNALGELDKMTFSFLIFGLMCTFLIEYVFTTQPSPSRIPLRRHLCMFLAFHIYCIQICLVLCMNTPTGAHSLAWGPTLDTGTEHEVFFGPQWPTTAPLELALVFPHCVAVHLERQKEKHKIQTKRKWYAWWLRRLGAREDTVCGVKEDFYIPSHWFATRKATKYGKALPCTDVVSSIAQIKSRLVNIDTIDLPGARKFSVMHLIKRYGHLQRAWRVPCPIYFRNRAHTPWRHASVLTLVKLLHAFGIHPKCSGTYPLHHGPYTTQGDCPRAQWVQFPDCLGLHTPSFAGTSLYGIPFRLCLIFIGRMPFSQLQNTICCQETQIFHSVNGLRRDGARPIRYKFYSCPCYLPQFSWYLPIHPRPWYSWEQKANWCYIFLTFQTFQVWIKPNYKWMQLGMTHMRP